MVILLFLADVIANNVADVLPLQCVATIGRLMLLPMAGGIATCCLFVICFMGRCYYPVADGIATFCML